MRRLMRKERVAVSELLAVYGKQNETGPYRGLAKPEISTGPSTKSPALPPQQGPLARQRSNKPGTYSTRQT